MDLGTVLIDYTDSYVFLKSGELEFFYGSSSSGFTFFRVQKREQKIYELEKSQIRTLCKNVELISSHDYLLAGIGLYLQEQQVEAMAKKGVILKPIADMKKEGIEKYFKQNPHEKNYEFPNEFQL